MSRGLTGIVVLFLGVAAVIVILGLRPAPGPVPHGRIPVVAAENVYGDIAAQIGGRHVAVTSILSDPNADPHLFEPGTANGLAVSRAALVIQNGLGYDSFMQKLEAAAPSGHREVVTIARVLRIHGPDANPHLWYDVPRLDRIAGAIAAGLERADPAHRGAYRQGLTRFDHSLTPLRRAVAAIRARFGGVPVAYTEPVPGYLLTAAGLPNRTPEEFSRAIEDGSEPSPQAVAAMTTLLADRRVRVLLFNRQAVSPITSRVRAAAQAAGIPVVGVTETLPPRRTFLRWQLAQVLALEEALRR
jgi:zinc/manganese transport system substrate-binding protein